MATLESYLPSTLQPTLTTSSSSSSSSSTQLPAIARRLLGHRRLPLKVKGRVGSVHWAGSSISLQGLPVLRPSQQQQQQQQQEQQLHIKAEEQAPPLQQQKQKQGSIAFTHWDAAVYPKGGPSPTTAAIPHAQNSNVQADGGAVAWKDPGAAFASDMDSSSSSSMIGGRGGPSPQAAGEAGPGRSLGPGFRVEGSRKVFRQLVGSGAGEVVVGDKQQNLQLRRIMMNTSDVRSLLPLPRPLQQQQHRNLQDALDKEDDRRSGAAAGVGSISGSDRNGGQASPASENSSSSSSSSNNRSSGGIIYGTAKSTSTSGSSKQLKMLQGDLSLSSSQRMLRACFYVWVSAMNLVGISSLWATCADVFTPSAGARLFGCISAGATLGQLFGSLVAVTISHAAATAAAAAAAGAGGIGGVDERGEASPVAGLFLASMVMQLLAAWLAPRIRRSAPAESVRGSLAGSSSGDGVSSNRTSSSGKAR